MIKQETIQKIYDAANIEEVVGDFVNLKKRGTSLIGLCPFHDEKTPSFHVSMAKGIYKCFGCGKGGDPVNFVMEHEKYAYPEALKYLAQKYGIDVEEDHQQTPQENDDRESLYVISSFAQKHFSDQLHDGREGETIGLAYFTERGFTAEVIKKFGLGYALRSRDHLYKTAVALNYQEQYLEKSGLCIKSEQETFFDRFAGRVIFPIHNLTGRICGFGARVIRNTEKTAKYLNSPESEIYHKSEVLYGIYFAKNKIREKDECLLVEGYADVISLHQSGIENVVSSSGTSLTVAQAKMISRFTRNIAVVYDGDAAGIKASIRGIDLLLEEGLNVKVLLLPDGHDPDSFVKAMGSISFSSFKEKNQQGFIAFKAALLHRESQGDPVKKAQGIRGILESIARVSDAIKASLFVRECSVLLDIDERSLLTELNKLRQASSPAKGAGSQGAPMPDDNTLKVESLVGAQNLQEREILRLLLNYGTALLEDGLTVSQFILEQTTDIVFKDTTCHKFFEAYKEQCSGEGQDDSATENFFIKHGDRHLSDLAIALLSEPYQLSENWARMHDISVKKEVEQLLISAQNAIYHLKKRKVEDMISENQEKMKQRLSPEALDDHLLVHQHLSALKQQISLELGIVVTR